MKEVIISKYGPPSVLKVREKRTPIPRKHEVLVRNYFTGINFSEIMARMRLYPGAPKPPSTLGAEGCGVIKSIGENVSKFQPGERVMVFSRYASYATHICTNEDMVMPLPDEFSFEEEPDPATVLYEELVADMLFQRGGTWEIINGFKPLSSNNLTK